MDFVLTLMQIAALATAGMCHALLGTVKVPLARQLDIGEDRVGGLASVFGFTLIPMVLAAGFLVDVLGQQAVLSAGLVMVLVSLAMLAVLKTYRVAVVAVLILGSGWSALVNVLNVTSPSAVLSPEDVRERVSYAMNMGDFIFGLGAFVTPIFVTWIAARLGLAKAFLLAASVAVVPLLLGLGVDWEALHVETQDSVIGGLATLMSDPIVWICSIAFFFHVPIEASVAMWATTLMIDRKVGEARAATFLSIFWLAFMSSRLLTALLLPAGFDTTLVIVMAALCIVFTIGLVQSRSKELTCSLIIAAGLILGPIFPTLIAILLEHVEVSLHGRTVGIFFCVGGIGWTLVPILIGAYAKKTSVQRSFIIAVGCAVALTALAGALLLALGE